MNTTAIVKRKKKERIFCKTFGGEKVMPSKSLVY